MTSQWRLLYPRNFKPMPTMGKGAYEKGMTIESLVMNPPGIINTITDRFGNLS